MREHRVLGARTVSVDRTQVHHGADPRQRTQAGRGITHAALLDVDAAALELSGELVLAVHKDVEDADAVTGGDELVHHRRAETAGATGHDSVCAPPLRVTAPLRSRSGRLC